MKKNVIISGVIGFVSGVVTGAIVTYGRCREKFNRLMQKELLNTQNEYNDAMARQKDYYEALMDYNNDPEDDGSEESENKHSDELAKAAREKPDITSYTGYYKKTNSPENDLKVEDINVEEVTRVPENAVLEEDEYVDEPDENSPEEADPTAEYPEIISYDQMGELYGYDTDNLTLYSDGFLVDDAFDVIEDTSGIFMGDMMTEFLASNKDTICIRSHSERCDYEIAKDKRSWTRQVKKKYLAEDDD